MSDVEHECRRHILLAYMRWAIAVGRRPINAIAYARALGVDWPD